MNFYELIIHENSPIKAYVIPLRNKLFGDEILKKISTSLLNFLVSLRQTMFKFVSILKQNYRVNTISIT